MQKNNLQTNLFEEVIEKTDKRIEFFSEVDFLQSSIMEVRYLIDDKFLITFFENIVRKFSSIMSIISGYEILFEYDLDDYFEKYQNVTFTSFLLPGSNLISSKIHILRTLVRKVEVKYALLYKEFDFPFKDEIFSYINKLSLLLYYIAVSYK